MAHWLIRLFKHRLLDETDAKSALSAEALGRIEARVAQSEARHSGQIRVAVEAGLPLSYLRRSASVRERALMLFGKLRVWDTADNNGVLIYLLLAEHGLEIVADRGLDARVDAAEWAAIAARMATAFRGPGIEAGLGEAIDAVDALLVRHFPAAAGVARKNELPDAPFVA